MEEESCDTKEPEKRRLIGREENVEKKGKGKEGGFGSFGAEILLYNYGWQLVLQKDKCK